MPITRRRTTQKLTNRLLLDYDIVVGQVPPIRRPSEENAHYDSVAQQHQDAAVVLHKTRTSPSTY